MGTKDTTKKSKSQKVIESMLKNGNHNQQQVIFENDKEMIIVTGYSNHKHSKLIKHTFSSGTNQVLKVNGELSFNDFVKKVKSEQTDE